MFGVVCHVSNEEQRKNLISKTVQVRSFVESLICHLFSKHDGKYKLKVVRQMWDVKVLFRFKNQLVEVSNSTTDELKSCYLCDGYRLSLLLENSYCFYFKWFFNAILSNG